MSQRPPGRAPTRYTLCYVNSNNLFVASASAAEVQNVQPENLKFSEMGEELKAAFDAGGVEECRRYLQHKRDEWKNIPLNIGVIGNSGVGKSSFINALRRLTADDEGGAQVGVTQCTQKVESYQHPDNPMLKFLDFPGVGTDAFRKETYLTEFAADLQRCDIFLLVTATRFTENDIWLSEEFGKLEKKYLFVRTKVEQDISGDKKAHPKTHSEKAVLEKIRLEAKEHLKDKDAPVFLIDSYMTSEFQFDELEQRVISEFPAAKRSALILSLNSTSEQMIQLKVDELRRRIWKRTALFAFLNLAHYVRAITIPSNIFRLLALTEQAMRGIQLDMSIFTDEAQFYLAQFGLDGESLRRYAKSHSVDSNKLKAFLEDAAVGVDDTILVKEIIRIHYEEAVGAANAVLPECLQSAVDLTSTKVSIGVTYLTLNGILDKCAKTATEVTMFTIDSAAKDVVSSGAN